MKITMKQTKKILILCTLSATLSACGFFDTDNTPPPSPLTSYHAEARVHTVWYKWTGFGVGSDYLRLPPAVTENAVYTANKGGYVVATNRTSGSTLWSVDTKKSLSAGPSAYNGLIFVGSREGDVLALSETDGKILWQAKVPSEVLAPVAANNNIAIVKTIDGKVTALSETDGHTLWNYQETEPTIILRGASAPQIKNNVAVIGFSNGNLAKLTLKDGNLLWKQTLASPDGIFAIQRMVDVDADPIIYKNKIYAATYQGKVVALDLASGKTFWSQDTSSYSGMAADDNQVYVSDSKSRVTAFNAENGAPSWRQTKLEARSITGPAIMDNYIVVGDEEGYLHWLSKQDGHFIARIKAGGRGIITTPVVYNNVLYVVTRDGHVAAYTLS